jgi:uncharacterized protein Usg
LCDDIINSSMVWIRKNLVTVDIYYYMPDYTDIIQQFVWQTDDVIPEFPRIHKFLNYWKDNIEAVIKEVHVSYTDHHNGYRTAEVIKEIKTWH